MWIKKSENDNIKFSIEDILCIIVNRSKKCQKIIGRVLMSKRVIKYIAGFVLALCMIAGVGKVEASAAPKYGIDVSYHQGAINWAQVKASGVVQFAFIRGGSFKSGVDKCFYQNIEGAIANGIPVGIYVYSYASTPQQAAQEGLFAVSCARNYPISLPLVFDIEGDTIKNASQETLQAMITSFCQVVESAGYKPMIYSSKNHFLNRIGNIPQDKWVAQYASACQYSGHSVWQYTSSGSVPGIAGRVDCNVMYKDYSAEIPANGFKKVGANTFYMENYMVHKGWLVVGKKRYYMDPLLGVMQTGLVADGTGIYYCGPDGVMQTGIINVNGLNFYFDPATGAMVTNQVVKVGKKQYIVDAVGIVTPMP